MITMIFINERFLRGRFKNCTLETIFPLVSIVSGKNCLSSQVENLIDMKEEQILWKKTHLSEKKESMKRRDSHHDYAERRMYMITIEVEGRRALFGHVEGDVAAPNGSDEAPHIVLSALGKMVQDEWLGIPRFFPQIEVMAVQMMPDHMHGILFVKDRLPVHLGQVISGFKAGCRKMMRGETSAEPMLAGKDRKTRVEPMLAGKEREIPAEPMLAEKERKTSAEPMFAGKERGICQQGTVAPSSGSGYMPLFAKGYNDLILRSYEELETWKNYLRENPRRLMMKRSNPEFLRPFFGLRIGEFTFNGIGNRGLLQVERRVAVRVSRRLVGEDLDRTVERVLREAREGAVLVSPAISPGEKRIMRAAFDEGLPTIVIVENGFTKLSKPHGEQFYACGEGRLLMLSAWEHHNDKRKLTAYQFVQLNMMGFAICKGG